MDERKEVQTAIAVMMDQLSAIEALKVSKGWELFAYAVQASRDMSYELMVKAESDRYGAVQTGAYHATRSLLRWPDAQIQLLTDQIRVARERLKQLGG